ncbi:MAG: 50S ribosomal protein L30 [Candidatus Lokiarchaeota archaeon]|nr:50S ribosomal protein L30 [Candidatus Lokiarchaeota archaeon]
MPRGKKNKKENSAKLYLVIRVRGAPNMNYKIADTLRMLRLHKPNHCVVLYTDKTVLGMLKKVKDYVAYGEITKPTLIKLLRKRALIKGNKPLTEQHLKRKTDFGSINELANILMKGKAKLNDIYSLKPVFRLHPPRGGFRGSIKQAYGAGGTLGNVGTYINTLALKMM